MRQRFSQLILHPLFIALVPILALYTANIDQVDINVIWRPMFLSGFLALAIWGGLKLFLKSNSQAALLSSWGLIVFFTYGHVRYVVLEYLPTLGRHRFFLPAWLALALIVAVAILRMQRDPQPLHQFLNILGGAMILIQILLIGQNWFQTIQVRQSKGSQEIALTQPVTPPDIYWIILDGYTRADVLQKIYGYDNSVFLDQLEGLGFFVADCALANYRTTVISLSSSLSLSYFNGEDDAAKYFPELIKHNVVRSSLESIGYKMVAFETGFGFLNLVDSDVYIKTLSPRHVHDFEFMLLQTTLGELFWDYLAGDTTGNYSWIVYQPKAVRDQAILDQLGDAARIPGPKFVYAHLTTTHPPFVLTEDGPFKESLFYSNHGFPQDSEWFRRAYVAQIQVTNQAIYEVIQEILETSETPPIIVLQGDHGVVAEDSDNPLPANIRMPILYAILLPDSRNLLSSHFSPVNSFRLIFQRVFGADLDLLPNQSFYDDEEYHDTWESCR